MRRRGLLPLCILLVVFFGCLFPLCPRTPAHASRSPSLYLSTWLEWDARRIRRATGDSRRTEQETPIRSGGEEDTSPSPTVSLALVAAAAAAAQQRESGGELSLSLSLSLPHIPHESQRRHRQRRSCSRSQQRHSSTPAGSQHVSSSQALFYLLQRETSAPSPPLTATVQRRGWSATERQRGWRKRDRRQSGVGGGCSSVGGPTSSA